MKSYRKVLFVSGICIALISVVIIFQGNIFEENNSGIATIIGIIGISLIAAFSPWKVKKS